MNVKSILNVRRMFIALIIVILCSIASVSAADPQVNNEHVADVPIANASFSDVSVGSNGSFSDVTTDAARTSAEVARTSADAAKSDAEVASIAAASGIAVGARIADTAGINADADILMH